MTNNLGLYLHIPFCEKKCRYCDFYSTYLNEKLLDSYTAALIKSIKAWGGKLRRPISTVYFGGGTPSLLGKGILPLMEAIKESFTLEKNAEITLELNPHSHSAENLKLFKSAGINRLSIGMQSGIENELEALGRTHTFADTVSTVENARKVGFNNLSLDLMLGLPDSTSNTLKESLEKLLTLSPEHISAYILKIEQNTVFGKQKENLNLPDDDQTAEQYLLMCETLENAGYGHYEVSNFAKKGYESRHNLKYWNCDEYLGLGPAAHSFLEGKRFYYPRDIKDFISGNEPVFDSIGGEWEEYIMLRLRLKEGLNLATLESRYGKTLSAHTLRKINVFEKNGLVATNNNCVSLTNKGFLLSNAIISEILE